ncbi:hemerythrin HHE cation-binding protein [bacterium endosymbiont of Escarpia laminata]|nr:MAG: hemerythrin HHE cation-binding protein [bacterium endosymbiont of Escarpia laminata]RLJ20429.1 MAG: hemerythrin HHE cation-binding protein [bacterium endosymbiont of Escarpia laminata]
MSTISATMTHDHRRCDEIFAAAENETAKGDWAAAATQFEAFHAAMEHHFKMEEEVLFPAFEEITGMAMGPTEVMRGEHAQMRDLFQEMAESVDAKDQDRYLGLSDTLLVVMQQHNAKEEQMLYQMSDQVLGGQASELLQRMEAID